MLRGNENRDWNEQNRQNLNIDFGRLVNNDEDKIEQKYNEIISALNDLEQRFHYTDKPKEKEEFQSLMRKIQDCKNEHDTNLQVNNKQASLLTMATEFIHDDKIRGEIERQLDQMGKDQEYRTRTQMDDVEKDYRSQLNPEHRKKAGNRDVPGLQRGASERDSFNRNRPEENVRPDDTTRRGRESESDDDGPVV